MNITVTYTPKPTIKQSQVEDIFDEICTMDFDGFKPTLHEMNGLARDGQAGDGIYPEEKEPDGEEEDNLVDNGIADNRVEDNLVEEDKCVFKYIHITGTVNKGYENIFKFPAIFELECYTDGSAENGETTYTLEKIAETIRTETPVKYCGVIEPTANEFMESRLGVSLRRDWDTIRLESGKQILEMEDWFKSHKVVLSLKDTKKISELLSSLPETNSILYIDSFQFPYPRLTCVIYKGISKEAWSQF